MRTQAGAGLVDDGTVVQGLDGVDLAGAGVDAAEFVVDIAAQIDVAIAPQVQVSAQHRFVAEEVAALEREHRQLVGVDVGVGVGLPRVLEERLRQGLRTFEPVVRCSEAQFEVGAPLPVAQLAEQLLDPARVVFGPPLVFGNIARDEVVPWSGHAAMFHLQGLAPEGTAGQLGGAPCVVAAALGGDGQCAAQGVEAEQRVGAGNQRDAGDGRLRQQVPVHDIAEGLVDAHAVLENRQSLGHAHQRRGGEAAEADVELVGVALRRIDIDAGRVLFQELGQVALLLLAQLAPSIGLHVGRHIAQRRAQAGQWRDHDDVDARQLGGRLLGGERRRTAGDAGGQRDRLERQAARRRNAKHGCLQVCDETAHSSVRCPAG